MESSRKTPPGEEAFPMADQWVPDHKGEEARYAAEYPDMPMPPRGEAAEPVRMIKLPPIAEVPPTELS